MDLSQIKSELSIQDVADVLAQQKKNEILEKLTELDCKINASTQMINGFIKMNVEEFWENSEKAKAFSFLFGDMKVKMFVCPNVNIKEKNDLENAYWYELERIVYELTGGDMKVYVKAVGTYKGFQVAPVILDECLDLKLEKIEDFHAIRMEYLVLRSDFEKDWKTIYKNNITALKMAELGITGSIAVPELPILTLNELLDK